MTKWKSSFGPGRSPPRLQQFIKLLQKSIFSCAEPNVDGLKQRVQFICNHVQHMKSWSSETSSDIQTIRQLDFRD